MSLTHPKAQLSETQQSEQGLNVTSGRRPPVAPVVLLPLLAVIACGIGHFHMLAQAADSLFKGSKNQLAEGLKSTREWRGVVLVLVLVQSQRCLATTGESPEHAA